MTGSKTEIKTAARVYFKSRNDAKKSTSDWRAGRARYDRRELQNSINAYLARNAMPVYTDDDFDAFFASCFYLARNAGGFADVVYDSLNRMRTVYLGRQEPERK